jgi:hypothetical protein
VQSPAPAQARQDETDSFQKRGLCARRPEIHRFTPAKTAAAMAAIAEIRDPTSTWNPHALHVLLVFLHSQSITEPRRQRQTWMANMRSRWHRRALGSDHPEQLGLRRRW